MNWTHNLFDALSVLAAIALAGLAIAVATMAFLETRNKRRTLHQVTSGLTSLREAIDLAVRNEVSIADVFLGRAIELGRITARDAQRLAPLVESGTRSACMNLMRTSTTRTCFSVARV